MPTLTMPTPNAHAPEDGRSMQRPTPDAIICRRRDRLFRPDRGRPRRPERATSPDSLRLRAFSGRGSLALPPSRKGAEPSLAVVGLFEGLPASSVGGFYAP